jgi:DNA-binding XRE family transcriptional regulator
MSNRLAANRVHKHRVRSGLSPEQYGVHIGVSGMTVRRVEAGYTPFRSTQAKFARDMELEVDELFPLALDRRKRPSRAAVSA